MLGHGYGQPQVRIEIAVCTLAVEVGQGRVVRTGARDHHVVDLLRQALEELVEDGRVGRIEGCGAQRTEFGRGALQAPGIAAGEDDVGALGARPPGGLEPDPELPPITTTVCPGSCGSRLMAEAAGVVVMIPPRLAGATD